MRFQMVSTLVLDVLGIPVQLVGIIPKMYLFRYHMFVQCLKPDMLFL